MPTCIYICLQLTIYSWSECGSLVNNFPWWYILMNCFCTCYRNGKITDRRGQEIRPCPEVPGLLQRLHSEGYTLAVASRWDEPDRQTNRQTYRHTHIFHKNLFFQMLRKNVVTSIICNHVCYFRTSEIEGAKQLIKLLGWEDYFSYKQIYPGKKTQHFS